MFGRLPDDPWFEEIDPIIESWMYNSYVEDIREKMEYAREHGLLIGSFIDYDAVKKIIAVDNPDHMMTDEEFEQTTTELLGKSTAPTEEIEKPKRHRRRRKLVT